MIGMSGYKEKLVCVDCGRKLLPKEKESKWHLCHHCDKPVCFDCTHYEGILKDSLYMPYVEVIRLCRKCYGGKR